jgi:hypothetical protein
MLVPKKVSLNKFSDKLTRKSIDTVNLAAKYLVGSQKSPFGSRYGAVRKGSNSSNIRIFSHSKYQPNQVV